MKAFGKSTATNMLVIAADFDERAGVSGYIYSHWDSQF